MGRAFPRRLMRWKPCLRAVAPRSIRNWCIFWKAAAMPRPWLGSGRATNFQRGPRRLRVAASGARDEHQRQDFDGWRPVAGAKSLWRAQWGGLAGGGADDGKIRRSRGEARKKPRPR